MTLKIEPGNMDAALSRRRKDSLQFEIVPQDDGGYRLAVNGEVISCFYWASDELEKCVRTLERLAKSGDR